MRNKSLSGSVIYDDEACNGLSDEHVSQNAAKYTVAELRNQNSVKQLFSDNQFTNYHLYKYQKRIDRN